MITLRPGADVLEDIPHIFLVPKTHPERTVLFVHELQDLLLKNYGVNNVGVQSPTSFHVEEHDFIVALKQVPKDGHFCALKVLFKSYFDHDMDEKMNVLFKLKRKYGFEMFDGKTLEHLSYCKQQLKEHIKEMQQLKKEAFLHDLLPIYSLN